VINDEGLLVGNLSYQDFKVRLSTYILIKNVDVTPTLLFVVAVHQESKRNVERAEEAGRRISASVARTGAQHSISTHSLFAQQLDALRFVAHSIDDRCVVGYSLYFLIVRYS
jgi:hypothetical protein